MTPLLFITIVTLVLVILVYWILSSLEKRENGPRVQLPKKNNLKYETSQELFNYIDSELLQQQDVLRLQVNREDIKLYWNISSETWDSTMEKFGLAVQPEDVVIRLYDPNLNSKDIKVNDIKGSHKERVGIFHTNYAVLGIKANDDFVPLFLSQSLE